MLRQTTAFLRTPSQLISCRCYSGTLILTDRRIWYVWDSFLYLPFSKPTFDSLEIPLAEIIYIDNGTKSSRSLYVRTWSGNASSFLFQWFGRAIDDQIVRDIHSLIRQLHPERFQPVENPDLPR